VEMRSKGASQLLGATAEEREHTERMIHLYTVEGVSTKRISAILASEGRLNRKGKPYDPSTVRDVLKRAGVEMRHQRKQQPPRQWKSKFYEREGWVDPLEYYGVL